MTRGTRIGWIDWVRALGACSIVFLHVLVSTSRAVSMGQARLLWYTALGITLCRWAVPGFFMISGYLLLDSAREVGWKAVRRYVHRMVLVLLTFGFVFALLELVWTTYRAGGTLGWQLVPQALLRVATTQTWDHLWYVYVLTGIYLLLPLARCVQARWGAKGLEATTAVLVVVGLVVPTLASALRGDGHAIAMDAGPLPSYVLNLLAGLACFFVGGCLRNWRLTPVWMVLGISSATAMVLVSMCGIVRDAGDRGYIFLQGSFLACLYAAFVLLVLKRVVGERPVPAESPVALLSRDSFGIYVLHPLFIHVALLFVDPLMLPPVLYEVGMFGVALGPSIALTRLLRHVPVVGELL